MILILLVWAMFSPLSSGSDIKPIEDVVRDFGYDIESHIVHTSDGYKLTVHRLLRGDHRTTVGRGAHHSKAFVPNPDYGVPVLLMDGILQSSASNLAKGNGDAYTLADRGFDVWLPNYRGNMYSRQHETMLPSQPEFWNFTLHEMGTKDLPAAIDHVLETTHRQQLLYVGYSMGTTMFWILTSCRRDYQTKVAAMVAIAPVARPSNMALLNNPVIRSFLYSMFSAMWAVNDCEFMPYTENTASTLNWICTEKFRFLCENLLNNMNYIRQQEMEIKSAFKLIPYYPSGISMKVILHYIQIAGAKRFQQFDYGAGNQKVYGSPQPPEYDLKIIDLPLYFVYSDKDQVATRQDIEWLAQQLPRRPERKIESVKNFRHVEFNLNSDLENLLTKPLASLIAELAEEHRDSLVRVSEGFTANIFKATSLKAFGFDEDIMK